MLESEINDFITRIVGMRQSFPLLIEETKRSVKKAQDDFQGEIKKLPDGKDKDGRPIKISTPDHQFAIERTHRNLQSTLKAAELMPGVMLMGIVSQFDVFYAHIVRHVLSIYPHKIYESEKELKTVDVIKYSTIDELKDDLLDKYIGRILRDSHHDQLKWVEDALDLKLRKDEALLKRFIEITERRNLFVHCDGVVNQQYISVCKRHAVDISNISIGQKLNVDASYFDDACDLFIEIAFKLHQIIWRNITKNTDAKSADRPANNIIFNLIVSRNYRLAKTLCIFHKEHCAHHSDQEYKLMLCLNLAQCHKWLDEENEMKAVLSEFSWKSMSALFHLAYCVLTDDIDAAAKLMSAIPASESSFNKSFYGEWPIFQRFIKSNEFIEAYQSVYGEPFGYKESE